MSSRDIVATRKLNENKKAKLGRKGDTEIRNVGGEESHVNALEASLIDSYGKAGEDFTKSVGAGTINPYTGMREYHQDDDHSDDDHSTHSTMMTTDVDGYEVEAPNYDEPLYSAADLESNPSTIDDFFVATNQTTGQQSYSQFSEMSQVERDKYLMAEFGIDSANLKYISDLQDKPFEFLQSARDLQERGFGLQEQGFGMQGRQMQSDFGFSQRQLEGQRADASATLGRSTGQQYQQASQAASQAASQSGLATSGTIQGGLDQQMKQMFGDYSTGQQRAQRDYTLGMDQAQSTLDFGQEGLQLDREGLQLDRLGADLDLAKDSYAEGQRQMDKLYDEVAGVRQIQAGGGGKK